jgi:D-alanine transfer protein
MTIRRLGPMLMAVLLFSMTIYWMGPLTKTMVGHLWLPQGVTQTIGGSQSEVGFQGTILQEKAMESQDILPVYGSSEFSAYSEFHPSRIFEGKPSGFAPFLVGRGGTQDIIHALNIAALGDSLKDKKIAIILSAQWFSPEGIAPGYFNQNFSPLHTYRMLYNESLSKSAKQQLSERLLEFTATFDEHPTLQALLNQQVATRQTPSCQSVSLEVKGRIEMAELEARDAAKTILLTRQMNPDYIARNVTTTVPALPAWSVLKAKATEQAKAATQNNKFGILDEYYTEHIQSKLTENQGSASKAALYPSPEYQDLELLLQILEDVNAKPLFIIVPVNGPWYDYTGFPAEERQAYYARIETMVRDKDFEVENFVDHEYDAYFLQDIMHLGWKGWVYVDEALDQFYHERT